MTELKHKIATVVRSKRQSLSNHERLIKSASILEKLFALSVFQQAKTVLFYLSTEQEVDTTIMVKAFLQSQEKTVVVPYVQEGNVLLQLSPITSLEDVEKGSFDIREPKKEVRSEIDPESIDLAIVPGVAFDSKKNRIGYGLGYYDRLLKTLPNATTIGLCFRCQMVDNIPVEDHDVPMNIVIHEDAVIE